MNVFELFIRENCIQEFNKSRLIDTNYPKYPYRNNPNTQALEVMTESGNWEEVE